MKRGVPGTLKPVWSFWGYRVIRFVLLIVNIIK